MNSKTLQTAVAVAAVGALTQLLITQMFAPRPAVPSPASLLPTDAPRRY